MFLFNWLFKKLDKETTPSVIHFPGGQKSCVLQVEPTISPEMAMERLGIEPYSAAIAIHTGAAHMTDDYLEKLKQLFLELARFADKHNVLVLDGATDVGSIKLIGDARAEINGSFQLLGVTVQGSVTYPNGPAADDPRTESVTGSPRWTLHPSHTHFLIVRGEGFGIESRLLAGLTKAGHVPSLALIVNGGQIVEQEAELHARNGVPLLALRGSGRFADRLCDSTPDSDLRANYPPGTAVKVFDANTQSPQDFYQLLSDMLVVD
jgi:hypothetical protein